MISRILNNIKNIMIKNRSIRILIINQNMIMNKLYNNNKSIFRIIKRMNKTYIEISSNNFNQMIARIIKSIFNKILKKMSNK